MSETIHRLIEQYGLLAVFLGCVAEGESAAILGGFFAHQAVFVPWQAFAAAFGGAFVGDTLFFLAGRYFSKRPFVQRMRTKPLFVRAERLVTTHPDLFVLFSRFAYGLRVAGGIAAGFSGIALSRFLALNAVSSAVWAAIFCGVGYVFGLGAEQIIGAALARHERLLIALAIGSAATVIAALVAYKMAARLRARTADRPLDS